MLGNAPNQEYLSTLFAGSSMSLMTCFMNAVVSASLQKYVVAAYSTQPIYFAER